jgi:hypothetical protein
MFRRVAFVLIVDSLTAYFITELFNKRSSSLVIKQGVHNVVALAQCLSKPRHPSDRRRQMISAGKTDSKTVFLNLS